jgi:chloramphenicol 3-O-phosphotransferase
MSDAHVKQMYNDVRKGMGLKEDIDFEFEELLTEGVHDKAIFKAVFLAGGPGSGKDYVLSNTLDGQGMIEINSDKALEFLMDKKGLDKRMPESEKDARDLVRGRAKNMTEVKQRLALTGRNGLIINGTGDDVEKIERIKNALEDLGYESSMILVNTSDEISAARNIERGQRGGRTVPETIRKQKWDAVQNGRTEFAKMFGDGYMEFDNSEDLREADPDTVKAKKDEMLQIFKSVQNFITQPPKSEQSQEWIANELQQADRGPKPKNGVEQVPPSDSEASSEARQLGLQYYGFGRYGRDGKVTHRSVHDRLVAVTGKTPNQSKVAVSSSSGSGMRKEEISLDEDLRNWFSKTHPEGDWKRINSKGEAIGPCAREPGEPKPKCMSKEKRQQLSKKERAAAVAVKRKHDPVADRSGKGGKPVNVSNYGKGKLSESYDLSDSSAMNLLLLGSSVDEHDFQIGEEKEVKLLKDKTGKVRVFMLRAAAAREAHTHSGTVIKYKNGYVIQLKENENDKIHTKTVRTWLEGRQTSVGWTSPSSNREGQGLLTEASRSLGSTSDRAEESRERPKITLAEIRSKKEKLQEEKQWNRSAWTKSTQINEIDRGIEPGVSMAGAGESIGRDMGEKIKKRSHKVTTVEAIGAGGEMATSMSDYNENDLRRKGIDLKTFKAKRPIG